MGPCFGEVLISTMYKNAAHILCKRTCRIFACDTACGLVICPRLHGIRYVKTYVPFSSANVSSFLFFLFRGIRRLFSEGPKLLVSAIIQYNDIKE